MAHVGIKDTMLSNLKVGYFLVSCAILRRELVPMTLEIDTKEHKSFLSCEKEAVVSI